MRRSSILLSTALVALVSVAANAQMSEKPATSPAAPDVGQMAPEFSSAWADAAGAKAAPVKLSALRGKVVVVAFYPKDRTSGCTAEMTKFRDEYSRLFGDNVVVLPVSADSINSHVSWATDMKFPFGLVSDPTFAMADAYGSHMAGRPYDNRTVFVIGKDGKVVWREMKFNALNQEAYTSMAEAVAKAR